MMYKVCLCQSCLDYNLKHGVEPPLPSCHHQHFHFIKCYTTKGQKGG